MSSLFGKNKPMVDKLTGLSGRTFERTTGCWNCIHGSSEAARKFWLDQREKDLKTATEVALGSPVGEKEPTVVNIRRMTTLIDEAVFKGDLIKCKGSGVDAKDNPVGDLVKSNYLCRKWTGAQGASVARAGEAIDLLPMELEDKHK
jgi:hypothetical protein